MAAKGYVVLYPNPRGSTTYGQEFGNVIQYNYPGDDDKDLMAGVDELVKRGIVDPEQLGVTGGSGGGVLTNWIDRPDRPLRGGGRAALDRRLARLLVHGRFHPVPRRPGSTARPGRTRRTSGALADHLRQQHHDAADADRGRGGLPHASRRGRRADVPRPEVPQDAGGDGAFPGETHELSRSGKPWHRVERLQHIVAWIDKYLRAEHQDLRRAIARQSRKARPVPAKVREAGSGTAASMPAALEVMDPPEATSR